MASIVSRYKRSRLLEGEERLTETLDGQRNSQVGAQAAGEDEPVPDRVVIG